MAKGRWAVLPALLLLLVPAACSGDAPPAASREALAPPAAAVEREEPAAEAAGEAAHSIEFLLPGNEGAWSDVFLVEEGFPRQWEHFLLPEEDEGDFRQTVLGDGNVLLEQTTYGRYGYGSASFTRCWIYRPAQGERALLCIAGSKKRHDMELYTLDSGYALLAPDCLLAFDRDFLPLEKQPVLPEGWRPLHLQEWDGDILLYARAVYREAGADNPFSKEESGLALGLYTREWEPVLEAASAEIEAHSRRTYADILPRRYGKYLFLQSIRLDLEEARVDQIPAEYIWWEDSCFYSLWLPWGEQEGEPAVTLWREGEPAAGREVPELARSVATDPNFMEMEYDSQAEILTVRYPTAVFTIPLGEGPVVREDIYTGYAIARSPGGRYKAYYADIGFYAMVSRPYGIWVEDALTGKRRYLYYWDRDHIGEKIILTDQVLYRALDNIFYDLATGEELDFRLQWRDNRRDDYPESPGYGGNRVEDSVWPFVLAYAPVPELGGHVTVRLQEYDAYPPAPYVRVELFDGAGRQYLEWNTPFTTNMVWTGAAYEYQPAMVDIQLEGTTLRFADRGLSFDVLGWIGPDDPPIPPGVVELDLVTLRWRKMAGTKWQRLEDGGMVTADLTWDYEDGRYTETFSCYKYRDGELLDMFSIHFEVEDWSGLNHWDIRYLEEADGVELTGYPGEGDRLVYYFTGALEDRGEASGE